MPFFSAVLVKADPLQDHLAAQQSDLVDSYIQLYGNSEIMGTPHSVSHFPDNRYNKAVPIGNSVFYNGLDEYLIADKALDTNYILSANIEKRIKYEPNNVQTDIYKLKTIIAVSDSVGRDGSSQDCYYILSVFGLDNHSPNKTAIVTEYPVVANQYTLHLDQVNSCMFIRDQATYDLKSFSKVLPGFLAGTAQVVNIYDIMKDI